MASGVAHDFNNLLTPILAYAELVQSDLPDDSPLRPHVARIEAAATQAAVLAQQVLALCRGLGAGPLVPVDLGAAVRRAEDLLRTAVPGSVEILIDTSRAEGAPVRADEPRLQQVLLNLCVNAAQAMEGNGRIEIKVERAGGAARLTVEDEGPGVPVELRERIFEPFFTTRSGRGGTGIGLATVRRIVGDELGGSIRVRNRPAGGACFEVVLPLAEDRPADEQPPEEVGGGEEASQREAARLPVVLVGEKRGIVEILARVLAEHGFAPRPAAGPDGLQDAMDCGGERPAALVADCDSPGGPAAAAVRAARELVPDLPVILLVRRGDAHAGESLAGPGPVRRVEKPTRAQELLDALREAAGT
ncbi:MAG: hypothetical protein D6708_07900 [Candidatus Dadabacteria bacterium]|nr:MAG: hypothetical protein D6708_07900 [Candidatus Dadabacteria bacterium]